MECPLLAKNIIIAIDYPISGPLSASRDRYRANLCTGEICLFDGSTFTEIGAFDLVWRHDSDSIV